MAYACNCPPRHHDGPHYRPCESTVVVDSTDRIRAGACPTEGVAATTPSGRVIAFPGPEANRPHWSGTAQCRLSPGHSWTAVVPCSANPWLLECPSGCGLTGHLIGAEPESPYEAKVWAEQMWDAAREGK